jgi:hypothetical protein
MLDNCGPQPEKPVQLELSRETLADLVQEEGAAEGDEVGAEHGGVVLLGCGGAISAAAFCRGMTVDLLLCGGNG